jgi:hypothetical protein
MRTREKLRTQPHTQLFLTTLRYVATAVPSNPTPQKGSAMTRNLKAFGLVLVVAIALGAIVAQGASALVEHSFRSDSASGNTVLTGANESYTTGSSKHVLTLTPGFTFACDATFEGTNVGTIVDTVTVHPTYHNCASSLGGSPTVHTGGCNFILDTDTTQAEGHSTSSEHASVSLECESAHSASPHAIEITGPGCVIAIEATHASSVAVNQSLHGVRYANLSNHSGKNAGTLTATIRTIKFTATAGSLCGLAGHPAGTYSNGTYDGLASVTGYEDSTVVSGSTTSGRVWSHGPQVGITISTPT